MTPIGSKILIEAIKAPIEEVKGGIILSQVRTPDTFQKAKVLAVSPDLAAMLGGECRVKVGDTILYESGAAVEVEGGMLMDYRSAVAIL